MLEIKNITVGTKEDKKKILDQFSLTIHDGEIHVIMGPNGTGKSTLSKVIMGHSNYEVLSGDILLNQESILSLKVDERAKKGIFLAMQDPTVVEGVSNSEFIKTAYQEVSGKRINYFEFIKEIEEAVLKLNFSSDMIHRSLNQGFSGGEKKKNEILQLQMLKPSMIILDELDSGLDIDSLKIVCQNLLEYLEKYPHTSLLIITHYPRILEYLKPDYVHIMKDGNIKKTGDISLALELEKVGYHSINDVGDDGNDE